VTALCVLGCRIRGRHLPGCDDEHCGGCLPRQADDGNACQPCIERLAEKLAAIAELAPDARLVAAGLVRRGSGSGASGKPGSRPPLNDGATDALDEITNTLTTWARHIAETRGVEIPHA
jgi:hypothetical protein